MTKQEKAAKTKHDKFAARVWEGVKQMRKREGCTCKIHKGMTYEELRVLGGGCTDTPERSLIQGGMGRWVCPVLDAYRRRVPAPALEVSYD
jgi:hypothetical protein